MLRWELFLADPKFLGDGTSWGVAYQWGVDFGPNLVDGQHRLGGGVKHRSRQA